MDERIRKLYELTEAMAAKIDAAEYEELERFVDERERIIDELKELRLHQSPTEEHRKLAEKILQWDQIIQSRMQQLRSEASAGLRKLKDNRKQQQAYAPSYAIDGVYFDTRR